MISFLYILFYKNIFQIIGAN